MTNSKLDVVKNVTQSEAVDNPGDWKSPNPDSLS